MLHDLNQAWRSLTRRPVLLAVAILTLGIGIGLNTALFNVINVMLMKPLPVRDGDVVRLFVLDAGRLALVGLSCGLPPALGVNALLAGNLIGVRVADPAAIGAVVVVLGFASMLAASLPTRRAAGVDPIAALRTE